MHTLKNIISVSKRADNPAFYSDMKPSDIRLVITAALKREIPRDWFETRGVTVRTLAALKAGALKQQTGFKTGILIVITGAGLKAGEEAACRIRDNLKPLFVLNIGTCGLIDKKHALGKWIKPDFVADEEGNLLKLDTKLPTPCPDDIINIRSLISVGKAYPGNLPGSLERHDAIDMECYPQAKVFSETDIGFHCLKFGTDYSDSNTHSDFPGNLELFREKLKTLLSFIDLISPII